MLGAENPLNSQMVFLLLQKTPVRFPGLTSGSSRRPSNRNTFPNADFTDETLPRWDNAEDKQTNKHNLTWHL